MGNIAKPLVEGGVQQILPFKLSEGESHAIASAPSSFKKAGASSKGYQKLASTMSTSYASPPQDHQNQLEIAHKRTGSSPVLMPPVQQSNNISSHQRHPGPQADENPNYAEDKVIYF